jgi:hypothetical protein
MVYQTTRKLPSTADIDVRGFAAMVADTRSGPRKGLTMVAINLRPLEVSMELQIVRDALVARLWRFSQEIEIDFYNVDSRAIFMIPGQTETDILQASSEARTAIGIVVGPHAKSLRVETQELVRVLHTDRDLRALSEFLNTYVRTPKVFDTPIGPKGPYTDKHTAALRERIQQGGATAFIEEFGRTQPLARLNDGGDPVLVGNERFVAVNQLRHAMLPGVTLMAEKGDYERLGVALDEAMLEAIRLSNAGNKAHITVNLVAQTFLSEAFLRYAELFAQNTKDTELWVELPIEQALANFRQFQERQMELRKYRVFTMADRVRPEMLRRMERTNLDFEGYKLPADPKDLSLTNIRPEIDRLHKRKARVVITRIENVRQLNAAMDASVRHVQGYLVDRMLAQLHTYD